MSRNKSGVRRLIDRAIAAHMPKNERHRNPYIQLVTAIRWKSRLSSAVARCGNWDRLLKSIARMSKWHCLWKRHPFDWNPPTQRSLFIQLASLLEHLFAQYPVPKFMLRGALFEEESIFRLFLRLGAGQSPRVALKKLGSQYQLTKAMAREFMQAPESLSPLQAIGWAQVLALGGNRVLATELVKADGWQTIAGESEQTLWLQFVRFLVRCQNDFQASVPHNSLTISSHELKQMVRFLLDHRFRAAEQLLGVRTTSAEPLQPNLTLDGRTLRSFRRHMRNWQTDLAERIEEIVYRPPRRPNNPNVGYLPYMPLSPSWESSSIGEFRLTDETGTQYSIVEILTARGLIAEGGIMQHCVAAYHHLVARRMTTIWSLKVHLGDKDKRLLTIQVDTKCKRIVQVKGKRNREPFNDEKLILKQWMTQESLSFE